MVDCCLCIDLTLLDLKPKRLVGFWGMQMLGIPTGAPTSPSLDHWTSSGSWLEEAARTAARRDWSRMGLPGEQVAYALIVASYLTLRHRFASY